MPGLNDKWAKYGCDKCDDYGLLVLEVNVSNSDSKSGFQNYLNQNNVEYPGVWSQEGGRPISDEVGNGGTGNPQYIIYPDKTYTKTSTVPSSIPEHICNTSITNALTKEKINSNISFQKITKSNFTVNVLKEDVYSISFFTANGQLKEVIPEKLLSVGSHNISWEKGKIANGVYFVEVRNGQSITRQKVILE